MMSSRLFPIFSRFNTVLGPTILLIAGLWVFTSCDVFAYYEAKYIESAHGNATYGVQRAGISSEGYAQGNCVHCHEQHASINGTSHTPYAFGLFASSNPIDQTNNFCFQCHCRASSIQPNIENFDYGKTFGGGPEMSNNIKDAFNFGPPNQTWLTGSSHNLQYIRNGFQLTGSGSWVTNDTNACRLCHDPHTAQRNRIVTIIPGLLGVETALYHPLNVSQHTPRNLWGDERGSGYLEVQIEVATGLYQAPLRADSGYEPAGDGTQDGSNLPNYSRFCLGCHRYSIPNTFTDADPNTVGTGPLSMIDWSYIGNAHGERPESPNTDPCEYGYLKPPYNDPNENYVLACTDCHEPHGSQSAFLLRTVVNGKEVPPVKQWLGTMESSATWEFCTACHYLNVPCGPHACDNEPGGLKDCNEFGCAYCHLHSRIDF